MYAPSYGFGPGNPQQQPFNPNGGPPQPHPLNVNVNPHLQQQQPGPGQQPHMYNPQQQQQQYAVPGPPHQSPYNGAPGPGMGGNAGGMGMMPGSGMAQMGGGGGHAVPAYQTPYSSSPYGASIPTSSSSNLPPNFMPTSSGAPSFPMNAPNMNHPQQHRMQPPPNASTPTQSSGPRASPFGGVPHNTPPNAGSAQSQFSTPQNSNQTHLQTPNNNQQSHGGTIITPQTPNFPPGSQGGNAGSSIASPLSPGSEVREKERVTLLLEINRVLLLEAVSLHAHQAEAKKEETKDNTASPDGSGSGDKEKADKEKAEKSAIGKEYVECMRRLQSNLAYLAAIADRSHKPSSQIPPHPAIMYAPAITTKPLKIAALESPSDETKKEDGEEKKPEALQEEDRVELLKDQYKKLADLFPGVDPRKEAKPQQAAKPGDQNQNQQQKLQNDMLRQKMMQAQQQQNQAQQQVQNR